MPQQQQQLSSVASAAMCLSILQRLLKDESTVLAQLCYTVENINGPLLDNCDAAYHRLLPEIAPPMPVETIVALARRAGVGGSSNDGDGNGNGSGSGAHADVRLLQPQPVFVGQCGGASASSSLASTSVPPPSRKAAASPALTGKRGGGVGKGTATTKAAVSASASAPSRIFTFGEYWELFSNLPTLYGAQWELVRRLEAAVGDVAALLDRLSKESPPPPPPRALRRRTDTDNGADGGTTTTMTMTGAAAASLPSSPHTDGDKDTADASGSISKANNNGIDRKEERDDELGSLVTGLFCSPEMGRMIAELTMYAANYTSKAAPRILELGRLWRRSGSGGGGGGSGVNSSSSPPPVPPLSVAEQALLLRYGRFLDFLLRSFGPSGVPDDSRVHIAALPEIKGTTTTSAIAGGKPTATAAAPVMSAGGGSSSNGGNNTTTASTNTNVGGAGTVRGQMAHEAGSSSSGDGSGGGGGGGSSSAGTGAGKKNHHINSNNSGGGGATALRLPSIPPSWNGLHTLMMLLATPLACLRRYTHVARCIIEAHTLDSCSPSVVATFQDSFIAVADAQLREVGAMAMEELARHDVRAIMSLIDNSSSAVVLGAEAGSGGGAAGNGSMASAGSTGGGDTPLAQFRNHDPTRALIHYGRLHKRAGRGRHERLMFLFTDWLCYVEETTSGGSSSGRLLLRGAMPLESLRIIDVPDTSALDIVNCFELIYSTTKRFAFFISTPEQKRQWVEAIRFATRQRQRALLRAREAATAAKSRGSGKGPGVSVAAAAAAAAASSVSIFHAMMPTTGSAPLAAKSRLSRQHRCDHAWQDRLDSQRAAARAAATGEGEEEGQQSAAASHLADGATPLSLSAKSATAAAGPAHSGSTAATPPLPADDTTISHQHSNSASGQQQQQQQLPDSVRSGASAGAATSTPLAQLQQRHSRTNSISAHRQLEYDVTPWTRQSATHRRLRGSQDLFITITTGGPGTPGLAGLSVFPTAASFGSLSRRSSITSLAGSDNNQEDDGGESNDHDGSDRHRHHHQQRYDRQSSAGSSAQQQHLPPLAGDPSNTTAATTPTAIGSFQHATSLSGGVGVDDPLHAFRLAATATMSPFLGGSLLLRTASRAESVGAASTSSNRPTMISGAGIGTPLRRPVSERFEAASSTPSNNEKSSGGGGNSPGISQQRSQTMPAGDVTVSGGNSISRRSSATRPPPPPAAVRSANSAAALRRGGGAVPSAEVTAGGRDASDHSGESLLSPLHKDQPLLTAAHPNEGNGNDDGEEEGSAFPACTGSASENNDNGNENRGDDDGGEEEEDGTDLLGTGSESLVDEYSSLGLHKKSDSGGDDSVAAVSASAATAAAAPLTMDVSATFAPPSTDLPPPRGGPRRALTSVAGPLGCGHHEDDDDEEDEDEDDKDTATAVEERVTAVITAFRSSRHRDDDGGSGSGGDTTLEGGGGGTVSLGDWSESDSFATASPVIMAGRHGERPTIALASPSAAAAKERGVRAPSPASSPRQQRHFDPTPDLESILQRDEAPTAAGINEEEEGTDGDSGDAGSSTTNININSHENDNDEDDAPPSHDSSLDISDGEVKRHE